MTINDFGNRMNDKINWTDHSLHLANNFLLLNGDLILKNGKTDMYQACYSLPKIPTEMNDWCNKWLDEKGRKKLFDFIFK